MPEFRKVEFKPFTKEEKDALQFDTKASKRGIDEAVRQQLETTPKDERCKVSLKTMLRTRKARNRA